MHVLYRSALRNPEWSVGLTLREQTFAAVYAQSQMVYLYTPVSFRPSQTIVALRVRTQSSRPSSICFRRFFLRGDRFLSLLVAMGNVTSDELREFFPNAGPLFDVLHRRVSRRIPRARLTVNHTNDESYTSADDFVHAGEWPCFHADAGKFAEFVRRCIRKRTMVCECFSHGKRRLRGARDILLVAGDGTLLKGDTRTIRIGIDQIDRSKVMMPLDEEIE